MILFGETSKPDLYFAQILYRIDERCFQRSTYDDDQRKNQWWCEECAIWTNSNNTQDVDFSRWGRIVYNKLLT